MTDYSPHDNLANNPHGLSADELTPPLVHNGESVVCAPIQDDVLAFTNPDRARRSQLDAGDCVR